MVTGVCVCAEILQVYTCYNGLQRTKHTLLADIAISEFICSYSMYVYVCIVIPAYNELVYYSTVHPDELFKVAVTLQGGGSAILQCMPRISLNNIVVSESVV